MDFSNDVINKRSMILFSFCNRLVSEIWVRPCSIVCHTWCFWKNLATHNYLERLWILWRWSETVNSICSIHFCRYRWPERLDSRQEHDMYTFTVHFKISTVSNFLVSSICMLKMNQHALWEFKRFETLY